MESENNNGKIMLELTKDEAIILLDWLSRFNEKENPDSFEDKAEGRVLWDMEASLEKIVSETFDTNYAELLSNAREKVRD